MCKTCLPNVYFLVTIQRKYFKIYLTVFSCKTSTVICLKQDAVFSHNSCCGRSYKAIVQTENTRQPSIYFLCLIGESSAWNMDKKACDIIVAVSIDSL